MAEPDKTVHHSVQYGYPRERNLWGNCQYLYIQLCQSDSPQNGVFLNDVVELTAIYSLLIVSSIRQINDLLG
jgi:hypothetical protein